MAKNVPPLLPFHIVNLAGLLTLAILLLGVVVRPYQLGICLALILLLGTLYWRFRRNPAVVTWYLGGSLSVGLWIVACENVVTIDNALGTRLTAKLPLGLRLHSYVEANLGHRDVTMQGCCNDPLSYHYKPGSRVRYTYDCDTCNKPHEVVADETGFLNRPSGLEASRREADLVFAGDSAIQGYGVPSVVEFLREKIRIGMWNLSISGYGPRQKVNALMTYALPKNPKWLIVEFYSGNDVPDVMIDVACERVNDFRCKGSPPEVVRGFMAHPEYKTMLEVGPNRFDWLDPYAEGSLTLAVSRFLTDKLKGVVKYGLVGHGSQESPLTRASKESYNFTEVTYPANTSYPIRPDAFVNWTMAGMAETRKQYERFVTKLGDAGIGPVVILLYNPSSYEIYRDILLDRIPKFDQASEVQREALRSFAEKNGWVFLDLTPPLRSVLEDKPVWLYGRYDGAHWSQEGTAVVADVLAAELLKIISAPGREPISR